MQQREWAGRVSPEIDQALCILCGDCVPSCPCEALTLGVDAVILDQDLCVYCGDCEDVCPVGAIALPYQVVLGSRPADAPSDEE